VLINLKQRIFVFALDLTDFYSTLTAVTNRSFNTKINLSPSEVGITVRVESHKVAQVCIILPEQCRVICPLEAVR
jgi:hypothetical protein